MLFEWMRDSKTFTRVLKALGTDNRALFAYLQLHLKRWRTWTMAAYVIFDLDVHDHEGYGEYRQLAAPTVTQYGGRYIVRGGAASNLEGEWDPKRVVVLQFDTVEQARTWYDSPEYRAARAIRERTAHGKAIIVEGV
jgi:uncharacterized protein (DUF1330 family)